MILFINTCIAVAIAASDFKNEYVSLTQSRAETVGGNLKDFMEDILSLGLPIGVLEGIEKELKKTVKGDLNALYANVVNPDCMVLYSFPVQKKKTFFHPEIISNLMQSNRQKTLLIGSVYNTFIPIEDTMQKVVGGINIGIPQRYVYSKTINSLDTLIFTFIAFIIVTVVLLFWLTKRMIKPLELLTDSALALGEGELSVRVNINEKNEIGSLAESFNYMAQQLEEDHNKLTTYTIELERQNQKLQKAHENILQREKKLKDAQSQLVLSEKMASLGVLIAGVAHEINTPAGAIANVANDLRGRVEAIINVMMDIHDLTVEEMELLSSFTQEFTNSESLPTGSPQWKKSREVRKWLAEISVENEKDLVAILSKYNLLDKERLARWEILLRKPWVIDLLDSFGTINVGIKICESSIRKITDIIKALKYYAYTDMDKTSLVDINENIENVLLLMHNKLKYNIKVEKDLNPLPRIHCTSEISQVWTNLINNAYDALMESKTSDNISKIRIETKQKDHMVSVKIADNGVGIPGEHMDKMFDPFFTTKGIGKGTGLGLSIVSGVVKKHSGQIDVDSIPGKTSFTVSLPVENSTGT